MPSKIIMFPFSASIFVHLMMVKIPAKETLVDLYLQLKTKGEVSV